MSEAQAETASPPVAAPASPPPASPSWRDTLPDDLRASPSLAKFQDPGSLAKSYVELEGLIGRKGVVVPTEKDAPDVHARYREALGIPEKPDGYAIKVPEGTPKEVWNDGATQTLRDLAHRLNLTPAQAQGIAEAYVKLGGDGLAQDQQTREAARQAAEADLQKEWGQAYGAKTEMAKRALAEFGGDPLLAELQASGLGNHPGLVRAFAKIGEAMGEDRPAGMGGRTPGVFTPADAKAEIERITKDPQSPYWQPLHPEHAATYQRVRSLHEQAAAGQA